MKALKTIGIVVGVVALAASGVGLALGGAAAGAAAAGGSAALGATLMSVGTIASVAAGVIGVATSVFAPKPGFSTEGNPLAFQTNPQSGLPYAIGRTRFSGLRIHADTYDALAYKSESKDDVLSFAVLLSAGGEIDSIEKFRAEKQDVTFGAGGMATGLFASWMAMAVSLGAGGAALNLSFGGSLFPGWTVNHKLTGMAHALWDLRGDPKGEKFGAGVPEPEWIGKWVKVYDPRMDSTYPGGSGSHRALNENTYQWSNNPALHALTWALGRWQNGKRTLGIGSPVSNIRMADFVEAANVADANGWTCGGVEWSTESKWAVLKKMLQAGGAEPTMTGAMIGCRVNTPRVAIATVTGDKLLDGASFPSTRSRRDRFNTVIPRFRSEQHDWQIISGSPVSVPLYVTEDGGQRTKEIDFPLVQSEVGGNGLAQAGQLAAYEIVNSREAGPWRITVGPEYIWVKTGDVITLDVPDEGIAAQPVLVRKRSIDPASGKVTFEVETETTAKHDFALGKTTTPPPTYTPTPPDLTPPVPAAALWSLAKGFSADGLVAITIAGACEFPGADAVLMEYRKVGDANWLTLGKGEASAPVRHMVSPVAAKTAYEARVAYQSGTRVSGWRTLGPVTTDPDYFTNANDLNPLVPAAPTGMTSVAVVKTFASGNVRLRATYNFTASADPTHQNAIDAFEHGVYIADTNAPHTMGTSSDEKWDLAITDLTVSSHPSIFVEDGPADRWYTLGVRAVRKVAKSVHPSGWIKGPIRQSAPFRPAATQNFQGNIDGVPVGNLVDAFVNYSTDNDQNPLVPPAATGVTLSSIQFKDSTASLTIGWNYTHSTVANAPNNIDGFLPLIMMRQTPAGYTYNPADRNFMRAITPVPPDARSARLNGVPADWYHTGIVIPYRRVGSAIHPLGIIEATPAQSNSTTPHHPADSPNFTGKIADVLATLVGQATGAANNALNSNGTIKNDKVLTDSILAGAIRASDWTQQGGTIDIPAGDVWGSSLWGAAMAISGKRVVVDVIIQWRIAVTNPVQGQEYSFAIKGLMDPAGAGTDLFSVDWTESVVWAQPSASGLKFGEIRHSHHQFVFDDPPAGNYNFGFVITTPAGNAIRLTPYRYILSVDLRAKEPA